MKRNLLGKLFKKSNSVTASSSGGTASSLAGKRHASSTNSLRGLLLRDNGSDTSSNGSIEDPSQVSPSTSTSTSQPQNDKQSTLERLKQDHFTCVCCFEIMREPVTLMCGHSLCQLCLANWFIASSSQK